MSMNAPPQPQPGRTAALVVYGLYLLSIPSAAVFALFGVILALVSRDGASPFARSHLDDQIRIWMIAFWWSVGLLLLALVGWILSVVLVGFLLVWLAGLLALGVYIWFTIKSFLGLLALLDNRMR
ncbi:MAG: hypothetical protein M0D54_17270 [Hyphomonadaceae bacterium JAD_PAG50586_4]|nr:MAG: hypothetical protein M0D54_17270 [Hyphomonadaceae bacterium JAD_PAG50586_4]